EDVEIVRFNPLSALDIDEEIASVLSLKKGKENKRDSQKLSQLLLKDYEWDLLKRIINALKPFEYATKFFSGSKYPTLLLMYPIIRELQNKFIDMSLEL
ncbi:3392_t:CDS:2, partial [Racocetra fulgida]